MITTIAMAVGSVVAKQAASVAFSKAAEWFLSRKDSNGVPEAVKPEDITMDDVIKSMDRIMEWSDE